MDKAGKRTDDKIDFVITWVDDSDIAWQREKAKYDSKLTDDEQAMNSAARYRDMGLLKYWFRGVEQYAPWVNRIHFVTCGQKPDWLNAEHPKLHLVNHADYMPADYLPTFNSNAIELGMHRIRGLSEQFVYFNDDMFLTAPVEQTDFFKKGLPVDMYEIKVLVSGTDIDTIKYIKLNNYGLINEHFMGRASKRRAFFKKISPRYPPRTNIRNIINLVYQAYIGIADHHVPIAYNMSTFKEVWEKEEALLTNVCANRFRTPYDYSHWIFRYWRLIKGEFSPTNLTKFSEYFLLKKSFKESVAAIREQKYKIICLNDSSGLADFARVKGELISAFESILPYKSSFEHCNAAINDLNKKL